MLITIDEIKAQLRLSDQQAGEEEALLLSYADVAEESVLDLLGMTVDELAETYGGIPKRVKQSILMIIDLWYGHRSPAETLSVSAVPYTVDFLLKPLIKLA